MELSELTTLLMNAISVWRSLARELGVDRNLDKDINCHYSMHTMILKWIRINKKKATVDAIVIALENSDIESSSLVEKIRSDPEVQTTYLIIPVSRKRVNPVPHSSILYSIAENGCSLRQGLTRLKFMFHGHS